jgi:DNA-binding transcriptional ArsR family regulator
MTAPQLLWDWGTAYDLFVSLAVLHDPAGFGIRGAWAAGVRARLPTIERETLEQSQSLIKIPFHWVYALPEPKDGTAVLWTLGQVPPAERLPLLALSPEIHSDVEAVLKGVAARQAWDEGDQEALRDAYQCAYGHSKEHEEPSPQKLASVLDLWARSEEFGERYLEALRAYQEVFFAEEERRIRPALQSAVSRGQELAGRLALPDLLEELSQGLRFDASPKTTELVLAPSYWCTPLMYLSTLSPTREIRLFGARPPDASLVPGETVPDALLRALKALSDPTRLRILHYLTEEPLTPAQLARRLRLRAPTVTHHLKALRLAGLVQLTLGMAEKGEDARHYATRSEAVAAAFDSLQGFLEKGERQSAEDEAGGDLLNDDQG